MPTWKTYLLCDLEPLPIETALLWQENILKIKRAGRISFNCLLLAQHLPVYTCNQESLQKQDKLFFKKDRDSLPAPFLPISGRPGSITYQGPGQITAYLIADFQDPIEFVKTIDRALLKTLGEYNVAGYTLKDLCQIAYPKIREQLFSQKIVTVDAEGVPKAKMAASGLWVITKEAEIRKLASRALSIKKQITSFGFAFNVSTDLKYFESIYPCSLDIKMTSLQKVLKRKVDLKKIAKSLEKNIIDCFEQY